MNRISLSAHKKPSDSGLALFFTLILVAMFFILGLTFMSRANFSAKLSKNLQESEEARLAANLALDNIRSSFVASFTSHHDSDIADYGYTYPIYEARRLDKDGKLLSTVYGGSYNNFMDINFAFESFWDGEKGLRSMRGINETNNKNSSNTYTQAHYNQFGKVKTSLHWIYYNNVIEPSWAPSQSDPIRKGFRYGYFLIDKTGLIDINTTKQRSGISSDPNAGVSFTNNHVAGSNEWYSEFDLSKVWTSCDHDPTANPIYNFDELFGREEIDGTITKAKPASLVSADKNYTGGTHNVHWWNSYGSSSSYTHRHVTTPYSVSETFPEFTAPAAKKGAPISKGVYSTPNGDKEHIRLALADDTAFNLILALPFFSRWGNNAATPDGAGGALTADEQRDTSLLKNQVGANIKDYLDADINPQTNYVSGAAISDAIYCGNERVPYLNEFTFTLNNDFNVEPLLYMKAELVWMYGATVATELGATKKDYSVKVIGEVEFTKVPFSTGVPAASSTTQTFSFDLLAKDAINGDGYFVTQVAQYNIEDNSANADEGSHRFGNTSNTASFKADNVTVKIKALELYVGKGAKKVLVDIADLPDTRQKTGVGGTETSYTYDIECNDPRNNTLSSEWASPRAAGWLAHTYSQERYKSSTYPSWGGEGSFGRANSTFATKYDSTGTAIAGELYPAYPHCDMETTTTSNYIDYDGTVSASTENVIDPTKISTRYMPINGGITHEVELGMISRGKAWQTINLTEYNLSDISKNYYNGNPQKSQYTAQYARTFMDDQRGISFHNPVGNVNTTDGTDKPTCDGGDRQLLDDVYIAGPDTLNDITNEKTVHGKFNINSVRLGALKNVIQSFSIPASGDEVPNAESTVLKDDNLSSPAQRHASGIIDRLNDVNLVHFMTKYTFDKTQPISATNSPNDPMRWGSKRLGTLFALRSNANPADAAAGLDRKYWEAYFRREVGETTITDRQKETLLLKLKDFSTVRYTQYSGIIIADSMQYSVNNISGSTQVTDAIAAYGNQVARPALFGKSLSQRQYRVELAYDHFLDKVVVLDYKYMGKLNQ